MGIRQRIYGAIQAIRGIEDVYAATVRPADVANQGRYVQRPYADLVKRYFSKWVYAAASRTASAVASMPIKTYRHRSAAGAKSAWAAKALANRSREWYATTNGQYARKAMADGEAIEEITDPLHPVNVLLATANPRDNGFDMIERLVLHCELTGNAYGAMVPGAMKWPAEWWPLAPQFVRALPDPQVFIKAYTYGKGTEVERTWEAADICHIRYPNPTGDDYYGMGTLQACVEEADLSAAFTRHALATVDNGVQPGLTVTMPGSTSKQREEARVELERIMRGPAQAGRTLFLGGPEKMTVAPWSMGDKEVAYLASQKDALEAIAVVFGMSAALLTMDNAALATAQAAMPMWRSMALIPRSRRIEDVLNSTLIKKFRETLNDPSLFVAFDTTESESADATSIRVQGEYNSDIIMLNEARRAIGKPAVPGGDQRKSELAPKPDHAVLPGDNMAQDKPQQDKPKEPAKSLIVYERAKVLLASELIAGKGTNLCRCGDCELHTKDDRLDKGEATLESRVSAVLRKWWPIVVEAVGKFRPIESVLYAAGAVDDLVKAAIPDIRKMFTLGYSKGNEAIGLRPSLGAFAVQNPDAEAFIREYTVRMAGNVTRSFARQVSNTIADGVAMGLSTEQVAKALQEALPGMTDMRAMMVARTETARAYTQGNIAAWEKSGEVAGKEWLLASDACEFCIAIAKRYKTVQLTDNFLPMGATIDGVDGGVMVLDYEAIGGPPLHPNCRCSVAPVMRKIPTGAST